jgi:hypothetical protein
MKGCSIRWVPFSSKGASLGLFRFLGAGPGGWVSLSKSRVGQYGTEDIPSKPTYYCLHAPTGSSDIPYAA